MRVCAIALLIPVAMLSSLTSAQADVPITQFVPAYGSSLPYSAVAGAALTLGAGTSFQGSAGFAQMSAASASSEFADAFAVKAALDGANSPTALAGDISGKTITPGVYSTDAALTINTDMTFDAQGDTGAVFIIRTPAAMDIAAGAKMHLAGGAQAPNVFWSIGGAITAGASSGLVGHFYSDTAIALGAGATTSGQLFAKAAIALGAMTSFTNDLATPRPTLVWLRSVNTIATQGESYRTEITVARASASSTPETSATFLIDSGALPAGLSLDTATGIIAGIPTTAGSYNFGVDAYVFGYSVISTTYSFTVRLAVLMTPPPTAAPVTATPIVPTAPSTTSNATTNAPISPPNRTPASAAIASETTSESQKKLQSYAAVDYLDYYGYSKLTSLEIASFEAWYFHNLKAEEFSQITPRALRGILPAQIRALKPATLSKLTPAHFAALSTSQVAQFTGPQINALPNKTLTTLTPKSISGLNSKAIWSIPYSIFRAMTPAQQRAMKIAGGRTLMKVKVTSPSKVKPCVSQGMQASSPRQSHAAVPASQISTASCKQPMET